MYKRLLRMISFSPLFYSFVHLALNFISILLFSFICFHFGFLDKSIFQVVEILTRNWREAAIGRSQKSSAISLNSSRYLVDAHLHRLGAGLCSNSSTTFSKEIIWVSDFSKGSLIGNFDLVTGINLQETQEKQGKKRAISIISTTAKYGSYRRAKKTTPNVRRRVPRQLTPIETEPKQVTLNNIYYLKRFCKSRN